MYPYLLIVKVFTVNFNILIKSVTSYIYMLCETLLEQSVYERTTFASNTNT